MKYLSLGNFKGFNSRLVVAKVSKYTATLFTPAAGSTPASSEVCADRLTQPLRAPFFVSLLSPSLRREPAWPTYL